MKKLVPLAGVVGWIASGGDWLVGLSLAVLALCWTMLPAEEGPPVLALATTMQWVAVTIGLFYVLVTGRPLEATIRADYRTMVALGLGCVVATVLGLAMGRDLIARVRPPQEGRPAHALTFKTLMLVYAVFTLSLSAFRLTDFDLGGFAMAVVALSYLRLGLVYLIFRRMVSRGEWHYIAGLLVLEIVLGITGFYAGFREPLIMAALAFLEYFDRRNARHWIAVGTLGAVMVTLGIVWIGVRVEYRSQYMEDERFSNSRSARIDLLRNAIDKWSAQSSQDLWINVDAFVDRMWTIYYPALAVERVPASIPHTDGALMADTLRFVLEPRIFFPDKPYIISDSQMVRKYSGISVAGEEQNTDIAFGYAAESYVDYGVPGMFVPAFIWALFIGVAIELIFREYHHRDMAVSVVTVIGWVSIYLFERSWAKTIGYGGSLLIYAGGLCYVLDRLWYEKFKKLYDGGSVGDEGEILETAPVLPLQPQTHSK
jgi:hypothetical protein